ncbi:substrate-binding periplasmic protein [Zooshikella ganghwensis]|nr:transporter substrate-binding domain-containing protein [Zooshikella ganghwensis]
MSEINVVLDAWPPFRMIHENTYSGIDIDLWNRIGQEMHLKVKYVRCPWGRCLRMMEEGLVDVMGGLAYRDERAEYMQYIYPAYYSCSTVFYRHKRNDINIKKYEDLYYYEVGFVIGSAYFYPFDQDSRIPKKGVGTEKQLLEMLALNRIQLIIGTDCQADYEIAQSSYRNLFDKVSYKPHNNVDLHLAISKKSPYFKRYKDFQETLIMLIKEGAIEGISSSYFK